MNYTETDKIHEECGVFGLFSLSGEQVAADICNGLIALQHRGQEAAGISVSDTTGPKGNITTRKGPGLVSEVFDRDSLDELKGNIGVGHVRYSTAGGSTVQNAQPIAMNYIKGSLALVHNGHILNAGDLKEKQMYRAQAHYTTSDSEVLAYEIISERTRTSSIEEAVCRAAAHIRGGYACLIMSPRKLVGIRDPFGIKPLALGKRGTTYILASESAAIKAVGATMIRDVNPGEIIVITESGIKSISSPTPDAYAHCIFEYIYFAREDSVIDGIEVYTARFRAGQSLARTDHIQADLVTGVPDSGLAAALGYAQESGIKYASVFHKNSYIGRSFIKPTDDERRAAVHMKLSVLESVVQGKSVILIDDSIVRGTTMKQIVEMLHAAGADRIHVRISSPPFMYPCYYGTDVPSTQNLIASDNAAETVCRRIGADSLRYLSMDGLREMVGSLPFCAACFDNHYPVTENE